MADGKPAEFKASFISAHKRQVYTLGWNCNGDKLATGSVDTTIRVWNLHESSGKLSDKYSSELKGHTESINHLAWHPEHPDQLASQSEKSVRLWDVKSSKSVASLSNVQSSHSMAWSPNGRELALNNDGSQLVIVDARKMKVLRSLNTSHAINHMSWSKNGKVMFLGTSEGTFEVFQYPSLTKMCEIEAHTASVYSMAISKDNRWAATGGADALLAIWDLQHLVCTRTIHRMEQPVRDVGFSADSQYLAYAATDPFVEVVEVATGTAVARVSAGTVKLAVDVLAWNPKKPIIAIAGDDKGAEMGRDTRDRDGIVGICALPLKK